MMIKYDGLNISQITIGSGCVRMRNAFEYDGLHRITAMNNAFLRLNPFLDAFSTTYSYDRAGNIKTLNRRGIIGTTPGNMQADVIDQLVYNYGGVESSVLSSVQDAASNPLAQPLGFKGPGASYGYDGNGNMTTGGPVTAQYNIMNLPTKLTTGAGTRHFAYVYGAGKYSARIEATPSPNTDLEETRHYLGGIEFKDGKPEVYNFGDGRIVYEEGELPRPQFRLHDHLGNTVVFFGDKQQPGQLGYSCITTEAEATNEEDLEILQRLWYYPFGMAMEKVAPYDADPEQWYRYNGKERDTLSGWTDFGARWGILDIGRWNGVDPLAGDYYGWSPFCFTLNNPISFIDPDGRSVDDTYKVDGKGNIEKVDEKKHFDKEGKEVDVLVSGEQIKYDQNGNIENAHITIQKGILRSNHKIKVLGGDGKESFGSIIQFGAMEGKGRETFEFLAEQTEVEWSLFKFKTITGSEKTILATSHEHNHDLVGASFANENKETLIFHDHSHPTRGYMIDDTRIMPSEGDKNFASKVRSVNSKAQFRVYFSRRYHQY